MPKYKVKYWERPELGIKDKSIECDEIRGEQDLIHFIRRDEKEGEMTVFTILRDRFVSAKLKE